MRILDKLRTDFDRIVESVKYIYRVWPSALVRLASAVFLFIYFVEFFINFITSLIHFLLFFLLFSLFRALISLYKHFVFPYVFRVLLF
jgi:hypothetical protein